MTRPLKTQTNARVSLQSMDRCTDGTHKWVATFTDGTRTPFGAMGYEDYTMHKDKQRRDRYIRRHRKDLSTGDPRRAGYLSMFVLWNKPTFMASLRDYQQRLRIWQRTKTFPTTL